MTRTARGYIITAFCMLMLSVMLCMPVAAWASPEGEASDEVAVEAVITEADDELSSDAETTQVVADGIEDAETVEAPDDEIADGIELSMDDLLDSEAAGIATELPESEAEAFEDTLTVAEPEVAIEPVVEKVELKTNAVATVAPVVSAPAKAAAAPAKAASAPASTKAAPATLTTQESTTAKPATVKPAAVPVKTAKTGSLHNKIVYIGSMANYSLLLDMSGCSKKAGGDAISWTYNGGKNQQWKLLWEAANAAYRILNVNSNLYLDVSGGKAKENADAIQWTGKKSDYANQLWIIDGDDTAGYVITSKLGAKWVLGLQGGKTSSGTDVVVESSKKSNGTQVAYQRWMIYPTTPSVTEKGSVLATGNGTYQIRRADGTNQIFDVAGVSETAGANVGLWTSNNGLNQRWYLTLVDSVNKLYTLTNLCSGKNLDIASSSILPNANIQQGNASSAASQKWILRDTGKKDSKGYSIYNIISKRSGMAVSTAGATEGSNVRTGFDRNYVAERFVFIPVDPVPNGFYYIGYSGKTGQVIDVPGAKTTNNLQLEIWESNAGFNQKVKATKVAGTKDVYTFQLANSGKFITAAGNGTVVQASRNNAATQQWRITAGANGLLFTNVSTGKKLTAAGNANGKLLNTSGATRFIMKKANLIENGLYHMKWSTSARVLDISGSSTANNAKFIIWTNTNGKNQKFTITSVGGNNYKIVNANSNKAIRSSGSTLAQIAYTGANDQKWIADISDSGGITFTNVATKKTLNLNGGNANGTAVNAATTNVSSAKQSWTLSKTTVYTALQQKAYERAKARGSKTNWFIAVDLSHHRTYVFKRVNGDWELQKDVINTVGHRTTPTPTGEYTVKRKRYSYDGYYYAKSYSAYYYTSIGNTGKYFHSPLYRWKAGPGNGKTYGGWGKNLSLGCVRQKLDDAKYIYNNVPLKTHVSVYK